MLFPLSRLWTTAMSGKTVLVYAGKGSSHSWVWLADLLEANGVFDTTFATASDFARGLERSPALAVVSGGDGFEIASALSGKGFEALKEYVSSGGRYFGMCAGAYLPLPSRIEPFSELNMSLTRIRNTKEAPANLDATSPREAVRYGSCCIFHPVRGEILVGLGEESLAAPIYGGPVFSEPEADRVVLRYRSFTPGTAFQVERSLAEQAMIGHPAVIECVHGDGQLILAGPHLEHPGYHAANELFLRLAGLPSRCDVMPTPTRCPSKCEPLDGSLADLKVAVLGMENDSFIHGAKQWDGSRMLELLRAIERRRMHLSSDDAQAVSKLLVQTRENLMSSGPQGFPDEDAAPELLVEAARIVVNARFRAARDGFILGDSH